jgi:hypothetical protein
MHSDAQRDAIKEREKGERERERARESGTSKNRYRKSTEGFEIPQSPQYTK